MLFFASLPLLWLSFGCSVMSPCNPIDYSLPGFPVLHYLLEFVQIHVHWVSDAISPSHPLLPPSSFAFNLSQHQVLFQWGGSLWSGGQSIGASASVLPINIQRWFPLLEPWFFFFFWYILVCLEQCFTHFRHFRSVCWIFKQMNEWMHVMNTRRRKWCIGHTRKRQG